MSVHLRLATDNGFAMSRPINSCGAADCHVCWGYCRDTPCPMLKEPLTEHELRLLRLRSALLATQSDMADRQLKRR